MSPITVIVGSSIGGVRTAQAMRGSGYRGEIVLVGEENQLPYDKPPLSKGVLGGSQRIDDIRLLSTEAARRDGITLRLGVRARRLDLAGRVVELDNGEQLHYDDVVLATGARARPVPWGATAGVHVLRTASDAQALRRDLAAGGHLVIVGSGLIGCEVASIARTLGLAVTVVDPAPVPLGRVVDAELGAYVAELHRGHGVTMRLGVGVKGIRESAEGVSVALTDSTFLDASTVVIGIGAEPNDEWLHGCGLRLDDGVVCDEYCRGLDAPRVHAVGDLARCWHPERGAFVRLEHWTNVVEQAGVVAHNIVYPDDLRRYVPSEYVWTDQYDWRMQIVGRTVGHHRHVAIGDPGTDRRFASLYADAGGRLVGAVTVNWPAAALRCRRALAGRTSLETVHAQLDRRRRAPADGEVALPC